MQSKEVCQISAGYSAPVRRVMSTQSARSATRCNRDEVSSDRHMKSLTSGVQSRSGRRRSVMQCEPRLNGVALRQKGQIELARYFRSMPRLSGADTYFCSLEFIGWMLAGKATISLSGAAAFKAKSDSRHSAHQLGRLRAACDMGESRCCLLYTSDFGVSALG